MTSFVFMTTAVVSSKLAPNHTVPACAVAPEQTMNPLAVPHTAVAVANVTCAAAEPRPDWVVPTVPHDELEIVARAYAPDAANSDHEAMTAAEPATVDALQELNRPSQVFAGPVAPFGTAA